MFYIFGSVWAVLVFLSNILCKITVFLFGFVLQGLAVTEGAWVAEAVVWPIPLFSLIYSLLLKELGFIFI